MRILVILLVAAASVATADPAPRHRKIVAEEAPVTPPPTGAVLVAAGASAGVDHALGVLPGARVSFYLPSGLTLSATAAAKQLGDTRESSTALLIGYRRAITRGRLSAWAGIEGGGGLAMDGPLTGTMASSPLALVTPHVGASVHAGRTVALGLELSMSGVLVRRDGAFTTLALPAAWLGAMFDL